MPLFFIDIFCYNYTMDSEQIYQTVRARFDHTQARHILKEKYEAKMIFAQQSGMWRAGPELISLLQCCSTETAVILDLYNNPIMVNVAQLKNEVQQRWQEQMNAWLVEYTELNQKR